MRPVTVIDIVGILLVIRPVQVIYIVGLVDIAGILVG